MNLDSIKIIDLVQPGKKVRFSHYKNREFWYKHDSGFLFPVPFSDVDDASSNPIMLAEDNAMFYMRWMRKHLADLKKEDLTLAKQIGDNLI